VSRVSGLLVGLTALTFAGVARAEDEVRLGSYGRVLAAGDLRGGGGGGVNVVSYPTRLEKGPYTELDVIFNQKRKDGFKVRAVTTLALSGDLFHYDGQWDADLAMRNLYAEMDGWAGDAPLTAWAGSRMVRGDDVHLFDFWPMDDLNTVGGGLVFHPEGWAVALHGGANRLAGGDWQVQDLALPRPGAVGTESVRVLDRQRALISARLERVVDLGDDRAVRVRLYGEEHLLPEGTRYVDEQNLAEVLPSDSGTLLGAQLSGWGWAENSYAHVWVKYAMGLAAFDELGTPLGGLAPDLTASGAHDLLLATEANHEAGRLSLLVGAYTRRFVDADPNDVDVDDRWEVAAALRPGVALSDHVTLFGEASVQRLAPDGLNPRTDQRDTPVVTKLSVFPTIRPGSGTFSRPELRVQYTYSHLNDDTRLWYAWEDARRQYAHHHFVGIGAEWWINSANYRR
jgi:hypothetical protein